MKPTNQLIHFNLGGGSVLGLPIWLDDSGAEFVQYKNEWYHISEAPLRPHIWNGRHYREEITSAKPRRVPVVHSDPVAPNLPAFQSTSEQQRVATSLHPEALKMPE